MRWYWKPPSVMCGGVGDIVPVLPHQDDSPGEGGEKVWGPWSQPQCWTGLRFCRDPARSAGRRAQFFEIGLSFGDAKGAWQKADSVPWTSFNDQTYLPPPQLHALPLSFLSSAPPLRIVAQRPKPFQDGHEYVPTTPPPPLLRLQGTDRQLDLDLSNGTRSRTPSKPDARLTTTRCSCGDER